eukprot:jgi/Ulvmu1/3820/UM018_0031.1
MCQHSDCHDSEAQGDSVNMWASGVWLMFQAVRGVWASTGSCGGVLVMDTCFQQFQHHEPVDANAADVVIVVVADVFQFSRAGSGGNDVRISRGEASTLHQYVERHCFKYVMYQCGTVAVVFFVLPVMHGVFQS